MTAARPLIISVFLLGAIHTFAQGEKPSIKVSCGLQEIHDDPGKEELYATIRYSWKAANANHVVILGLDDKPHELSGYIDLPGGGTRSYVFVAVGPNGSAIEAKGCIPTHKLGPGRHGLVWSWRPSYDPEREFQNSYKTELRTSLQPDDIQNRMIKVLQESQFAASVDYVSPEKDRFFFHTPEFNYHRLVCEEEDCNLPFEGAHHSVGGGRRSDTSYATCCCTAV